VCGCWRKTPGGRRPRRRYAAKSSKRRGISHIRKRLTGFKRLGVIGYRNMQCELKWAGTRTVRITSQWRGELMRLTPFVGMSDWGGSQIKKQGVDIVGVTHKGRGVLPS